MFSRRQIAFSCMGILFIASSSFAETEPQKGRLPDGRAFRIDSNGYQLVDHIAELEVTIEELKQQVLTLEDETVDKQARIDRLATSKGVDCRIAEKPAQPLPVARTAPVQADCAQAVNPLNTKIASLERQVQLLQQAPAPKPTVVTAAPPAPSCDAQTKPLYDQISRLQEELMSGPSKEEMSAQLSQAKDLRNQVSDRDSRVSSLGAEMQKSQEELNEARREIAQRTSREQELSEMVASLTTQVESLRSSAADRARLSRPESRPEEIAEVSEARKAEAEAIEEAKEQALKIPAELVGSTRASFQQQLTRIQGLIGSRKDLIDQAKGRKAGVSVQISPLVTSDGSSLDNLRASIANLNEDSPAENIQKGLVEIEAKLRDDIGILKRISKF